MRANEFILEELTLDQKNKLFKDLGNKYDANIHNNIFKGQSRIYAPLSIGTVNSAKSPLEKKIQNLIKPAGYEISDYKTGIAHKIDDPSRKIKIGKLVKDQALLQKFANDPDRAAAKQSTQLEIVYSKDPVDIAGMSTDRGWVSCMDLSGGANKQYVPVEIKNGAIIAYLIRADDQNIERPVARILIKPYYFENHLILVPGPVYGTAPKEFRAAVTKFCESVNASSPEGDYQLARGSYPDNQPTEYMHISDYTSMSTKSLKLRMAAAASNETPPTALAELANDQDKEVRRLAARNRATPLKSLAVLAQDQDKDVRLGVAENRTIGPEILALLAQDKKHQDVLLQVAKNRATPTDALAALAQGRSPALRAAVAMNTAALPETLELLAQDQNVKVRMGSALNPLTPIEALTELTQDKDVQVREILSLKAIPELLTLLAQDQDDFVRRRVALNPATLPEVLAKLTQDQDEDVREYAADNLSRAQKAAKKSRKVAED